MEYRTLGSSKLMVSRVCLGTWSLIGDETWGEQPEHASMSAIDAALDAGINFLDTAEMYGAGRSEEMIGRALAGRRGKVVLASKVGSQSLRPEALREHCEASLRRLQTDYLDLYQIHWPNPEVPLAETLGAMEELKRAGKIREIGVSNFGVSYLREPALAGRVVSNQVCYSLLWRPAEFEVAPECARMGLSVLCYSPLCQGLLTGKFRSAADVPTGRARTRLFAKSRPRSRHREHDREELVFDAIWLVRAIASEIGRPMNHVALAWLLAQPQVASVVCGARTAGQALDNAKAADILLDPQDVERLSDATEAVKRDVGPNVDMWQSDSRLERKK